MLQPFQLQSSHTRTDLHPTERRFARKRRNCWKQTQSQRKSTALQRI
jgi:hypothetical protein